MKWRRAVSLFHTHTAGMFKVGDLYETRDRETYRITRIKPLVPTSLLNGGVQPCSEVFGRRAK